MFRRPPEPWVAGSNPGGRAQDLRIGPRVKSPPVTVHGSARWRRSPRRVGVDRAALEHTAVNLDLRELVAEARTEVRPKRVGREQPQGQSRSAHLEVGVIDAQWLTLRRTGSGLGDCESDHCRVTYAGIDRGARARPLVALARSADHVTD